MKNDISVILNKLCAYAMDNLLLDTLDLQYALNRLASLVGCDPVPALDDVDYGDVNFTQLLDELKAAKPNADIAAVCSTLFPMPRTLNYYLQTRLDRAPEKAFEFLFELYAASGVINTAPALEKGNFCFYSADGAATVKAAALNVGDGQLYYTPVSTAGRVAYLDNPDILSDDMLSRMLYYVTTYGGAIAARVGGGSEYMCCQKLGLGNLTGEKLSDGTVKVTVLDYPVPVLAFNGIAKNTVAREAGRAVKAAVQANLPCVLAADNTNGVTFYLVFASDISPLSFFTGGAVLDVCGTVRVTDCSALLPVLEKGTALSTDLAKFKLLYDKVGGVKLAKTAPAVLAGALIELFTPVLSAAASCDRQTAIELCKTE